MQPDYIPTPGPVPSAISWFRRHRTLVLVLVVVLLVVASIIGFLVLRSQGAHEKHPTNTKPTFPNYLKPAAEIKVGSHRYVSPCQALTLGDVNTIFGGIGDDGYIIEDYYDASVKPVEKLDRSIETACRYLGEREVSLDVEQRYEAVDTSILSFVVYPLGSDKMNDKVKRYEQAVAKTNDGDLKSFVARLKRSVDVYNRQAEDRDADIKVDTKDFAIPVDREAFSFNVIHDNVVYKLDYTHKDWPKDQLTLSDADIVAGLKKSVRALAIIQKRAADAHLDQSPAPTVLGSTNKNGTTKILEPCALLTPQLYQAVVGSPANGATSRKSVSQNISKQRLAGNGQPLSPDNSCERNGRNGDTSTSVRLDMNHTASSEALAEAMKKGYTIDGEDKVLETSADSAAYLSLGPGNGISVFRVGPYSASLSILHTSSGGLWDDVRQSYGTEQQYIQLTNAVADAIRKSSK